MTDRDGAHDRIDRPMVFNHLGPDGPELTRSMDELSAYVKGGALQSIVDGTDTLTVAQEILDSAGTLTALGQLASSAELLRSFHLMQLPEDASTAEAFSQYRLESLRLLLESGVSPVDPEIRELAAAQAASLSPEDTSCMETYYLMAESSDDGYFAKWLSIGVSQMENSLEQTSPSDPFPPYAYRDQLLQLFRDDMVVAMSAGDQAVVAKGRLSIRLLDIGREFDVTDRKALFAHRIGPVVEHLAQMPGGDTASQASELQLNMLREGIESPQDIIGERVLGSRLHKNLVMSLISFGYRNGYREQVNRMLDGWRLSGLFDETEQSKIQVWKTDVLRQKR